MKRRPRLAAAAAWAVAGAVLTALPAQAEEASFQATVQASQQSFEAIAGQLKKRLAQQAGLGPGSGAATVGDIQFVYERSAVPQVRLDQSAGLPRITVTDGWARLVQDLALAQALGRPGCFRAYARHALAAAQASRAQAQAARAPAAWLRLADFLESAIDERAHPCHGLGRRQLAAPDVQARARTAVEAGWAWLLARETARWLALPSAGAACADREADLRGETWAQETLLVGPAHAAATVLTHAWLYAPPDRLRACVSGFDRLAGYAGRRLSLAERQGLLAAWPAN
jgi:hypothetical protein